MTHTELLALSLRALPSVTQLTRAQGGMCAGNNTGTPQVQRTLLRSFPILSSSVASPPSSTTARRPERRLPDRRNGVKMLMFAIVPGPVILYPRSKSHIQQQAGRGPLQLAEKL